MKAVIKPKKAEKILKKTFEHILLENMQGIPILNNNLAVETIGFQSYKGRTIGIVVTPWLMNLILLPNENDDWNKLELGKKVPVVFPSSTYKFMINEIDGIGKCKTHSLYSPMNEFFSQDHAVKTAQEFMDSLFIEREATVEELVDEDLLGCIMRGEDVEVNLDEFAQIEPFKQAVQSDPAQVKKGIPKNTDNASKLSQNISRRDLIRGSFLTS